MNTLSTAFKSSAWATIALLLPALTLLFAMSICAIPGPALAQTVEKVDPAVEKALRAEAWKTVLPLLD